MSCDIVCLKLTPKWSYFHYLGTFANQRNFVQIADVVIIDQLFEVLSPYFKMTAKIFGHYGMMLLSMLLPSSVDTYFLFILSIPINKFQTTKGMFVLIFFNCFNSSGITWCRKQAFHEILKVNSSVWIFFNLYHKQRFQTTKRKLGLAWGLWL